MSHRSLKCGCAVIYSLHSLIFIASQVMGALPIAMVTAVFISFSK